MVFTEKIEEGGHGKGETYVNEKGERRNEKAAGAQMYRMVISPFSFLISDF